MMTMDMAENLARQLASGQTDPKDVPVSVQELATFFVECIDVWKRWSTDADARAYNSDLSDLRTLAKGQPALEAAVARLAERRRPVPFFASYPDEGTLESAFTIVVWALHAREVLLDMQRDEGSLQLSAVHKDMDDGSLDICGDLSTVYDLERAFPKVTGLKFFDEKVELLRQYLNRKRESRTQYGPRPSPVYHEPTCTICNRPKSSHPTQDSEHSTPCMGIYPEESR